MNRVKGFTTDLATHSAAPFLHRHLYRAGAPQSILSCFAASVLYANRTPANTPMVLRALHGSVKDVVDGEAGRAVHRGGGGGAAAAASATPTERLARTQALFLYQVIRLLDGDVALRAQGERDMALLGPWLGDLCRLRENLGDVARRGDGAAREQPPVEWEVSLMSLRVLLLGYLPA